MWKLVVVIYIKTILSENWVSLKKTVDNLINLTSPKIYILENWSSSYNIMRESKSASSHKKMKIAQHWSKVIFLQILKENYHSLSSCVFFVVPLFFTMCIQWHKNCSIWLKNEKNIKICSMIDLCLMIGSCAVLTLWTRNHNEFWCFCSII